MRVELFGCRYTSPVISYSVAQGDQFSPRVYLEDVYDGQEDGGLLSGGLGLLSDGRMGGPLTFRGGGGLVSGQHIITFPGVSLLTSCHSIQLQAGWAGPTRSFPSS